MHSLFNLSSQSGLLEGRKAIKRQIEKCTEKTDGPRKTRFSNNVVAKMQWDRDFILNKRARLLFGVI